MVNKNHQVKKFIDYIKRKLKYSLKNGQNEISMIYISIISQILYQYNQVYTDLELERSVVFLAEELKVKFKHILNGFLPEKNTVLFYDGFGLDVRGVSKIYLNALKKNGYKIIYVTNLKSQNKLPETEAQMKDADIEWHYVRMNKSYVYWVEELLKIILKTRPKAMLYYTTPHDVSGAVAFALMDGLVDRFLIDLTDHAFWLGTHSNDYFLGSREMSASNQYYNRNIPKNKIIKLGVNLLVDESKDSNQLPFDVENTRYIFSGGSLYKTLGDDTNTYYRIVNHLVENHTDIKFLYAGTGDTSQMDVLINKYPGRVFLIDERKDFYNLIKNSVLYLNTYPMFGGMMMKYSACAGRLPITLKHDNDSDGLLINQKNARIEYDTYDELVADVDRLLTDAEYLRSRERLLEGTIITETRFVKNLRTVIEDHLTDYEHEFVELDTTAFRNEFYKRFNLEDVKMSVCNKLNRPALLRMPWIYKTYLKKKAIKFVRRFMKGCIK